MRRNCLKMIFAVTLLTMMSGCYYLREGTHLLSYNSRARDIDRLLEKKPLTDETREFLLRVQDIKEYATEEIGLVEDDNYSRFVEIPRDYLVTVVSACRDDSFEAYMWRYPVVGPLPYRGYYEGHRADAEADRIRKKGYDVYVRKVDAFSTLGVFSDPVYSFMMDYSIHSLADLIIHEQTHTTVFRKGQSQFNEELATFVGTEGAFNYIKDRFGESSDIYKSSKEIRADRLTLRHYLRDLYDGLDELYRGPFDREAKLREKSRLQDEARSEFANKYEERFLTDKFRGFSEVRLNNAYLRTYATYHQDLDSYYALYERFDFDLKAALEAIIRITRDTGDPKDAINRLSSGTEISSRGGELPGVLLSDMVEEE